MAGNGVPRTSLRQLSRQAKSALATTAPTATPAQEPMITLGITVALAPTDIPVAPGRPRRPAGGLGRVELSPIHILGG